MRRRPRLPPGEYSSLSQWLEGMTSHTAFYGDASSDIDFEHFGFVAIDHCVPVHQVGGLKAQSLAVGWRSNRKYVYEACEIVRAPEGPPLLGREETGMIIEALGPPPPPCYPLYFVSTRDRQSGVEELVYIGKTSSNQNRFAGGHGVFTKLHDPVFDGHDKRVYLGTVMLMDKAGRYLPLEAVRPLERAEDMLRAIEAQLIFELGPVLNVQARGRPLSRRPIDIHIQNTISDFLNDTFVYPPM